MRSLLSSLKKLKNSEVKDIVDQRIKEFKNNKDHFSELCFCLLTANFNAERSMMMQGKIAEGFSSLPRSQLTNKLKQLGHRFPNARASFIVEARKYKNNLKKILKSEDPRQWLVENIKGLGYKEASHFLRNIGFEDYAIIDFHIIDLLEKNNLVQKPKTLSKNKYSEIERLLKNIAKKSNLNLAELDLYLWYLETGKILK